MGSTKASRVPVIADVARVAGVSVPTVSRVLTGSAKVSQEKAQRVHEAIELLDYRPSATARALASRQSHTIAIVAGNTSQYGYAQTIRGVEEEARADGYTVTITVIESADPVEVSRAISLVQDQGPAGVVVLKFDPPGVAALGRLPRDLPTVAISGVRTREVPQAILDEQKSAQALVEHLLSLGHRTVHHVMVPPSRREDGRTTGWRRALKDAGAEIPTPFKASWMPESGRQIGLQLADDDAVTAVFCGNDEIAMGVVKGLADRGLRVPEDVSVAGFDDHPLSAMWSPALTTVHQDFVGLGKRAFELLREAISGDTSRRFSSDLPAVVLRESTGPAQQRSK